MSTGLMHVPDAALIGAIISTERQQPAGGKANDEDAAVKFSRRRRRRTTANIWRFISDVAPERVIIFTTRDNLRHAGSHDHHFVRIASRFERRCSFRAGRRPPHSLHARAGVPELSLHIMPVGAATGKCRVRPNLSSHNQRVP